MRGMGQIGLPLQPWQAPPSDVTVTGYTTGGGASPSNVVEAFNFLPLDLSQSASDTSVVGAPISSYVAAGEPLAGSGGGGGFSLPSNTSTWVWLAVVLVGGFMVIKAANL